MPADPIRRHATWRLTALYFFLLALFCESALPAADFDEVLVRPSDSVFDAAFAADGDVLFCGALVCDNALAAAFFEAAPVDLPLSVLDAADAALLLVTFAIAPAPIRGTPHPKNNRTAERVPGFFIM